MLCLHWALEEKREGMVISSPCEMSAPQAALKPFTPPPPNAGESFLFNGAVVSLHGLQGMASAGHQNFLALLDLGQYSRDSHPWGIGGEECDRIWVIEGQDQLV